MSIEHARAEDIPAIHELLSVSGLPTEDVDAGSVDAQWVWREHGAVIGTVGLDRAGDAALFRSLAVAPDHRSRGIASHLCDAVEVEARTAGVRMIYLLTETAARFAERRGFRRTPRSDVPAEVATLRQLSTGCCACATCMAKEIDR